MVLPTAARLSFQFRRMLWAVLLLLSACQTAFAPPYDPTLVTGFNEANTEALVLFAAVSGGSAAAAYGDHSGQYDSVIGAFDALELQAAVRQVPEFPTQILERVVPQGCSGADACSNNPTPFNLERIINNLNVMRERHASMGLSAGYVALRKVDHEIYARNVLIVEEYLKRE